MRVQLQALVNAFGFHNTNHFCVVGYGSKDDPDNFVLGFIYWPTQNKIIEWKSDENQAVMGGFCNTGKTRGVKSLAITTP